jgi:putative flippase GtrA
MVFQASLQTCHEGKSEPLGDFFSGPGRMFLGPHMELSSLRLRQLERFIFAGLLNTAFGFLIYAGLVWMGFPVWATVALSMLGALVFNYLTYGGIVFKGLSWRNFPRFMLFYVCLAGLNTAALHVMVLWSFGPFVSQAVLVVPLAVISYLGLTFFVFSKSSAPAG